MESATVSVIVPVYNAEAYLIDCINSLRAQTYPDFEVVLVDDGSTDRSAEIIRAFGKKDDRFRYAYIPNSGPSAARNEGMRIARGAYFCFVDADDFVEPNFLRVLMGCIDTADIAVSAKKRWNQNIGASRIDRCPDLRGTLSDLAPRFFRYRRIMRGVTGRVYRADVIRENDLQFDESLRYGEDMMFNYLVFGYAEEFVFVNQVLYTYRIHNPNSLSRLDRTSFVRRRRMQDDCIRELFEGLEQP